MNREFQAAIFQSSKYWERKLAPKELCDKSTVCPQNENSLNFERIIEETGERWHQVLFEEKQNYKCEIEDMPPQDSEELAFRPVESHIDSSSSCGECSRGKDSESIQKSGKVRKNKNKRSKLMTQVTKKRFTVAEEQQILNAVQLGIDFSSIARGIPGSTSRQIKHCYFRRIKFGSHNNPVDLSLVINEIQQLANNSNSEDRDRKKERLRSQIANLEQILHRTKLDLLHQYLAQLQ